MISCAGRTTAVDSLFVYDSGSSHASFVDSSFEPLFEATAVDNATMDNVTRMCGGSDQCVFDYFLTGKKSLALNSAEAVQEHATLVEASKHGMKNI